MDGDSGELARVVLAFVSQPRAEAEILAHVEALSGQPLGEGRAVVVQLLALLAETGAISEASEGSNGARIGLNVVVGVSGAIAATHAPALISALHRRGHTVEVALTQMAQRFVAVDALAAIAGRELHTTVWPATPHAPVPHVALAQWADLVVIYPASATTIGRLASGDFSDLVSAIALTTRAPVVLVPSMNVAMLAAPAVQRNLEKLRGDGFVVLHGVPSQEVADAPSVRTTAAGAAPAPSEVAATIDALRSAGVLRAASSDWDGAYRAARVPWASEQCDDDLVDALAAHAPRGRLLDAGCGLGQVARHAAGQGYHVVATELSEVAVELAARTDARITWLRDDICASSLAGTFDVIVDRATLHTLPPARVHAWAATMRRLTAPGSIVIVKAHRDGVPGVTRGWSGDAIAERLVDFELVADTPAELPGLAGPEPIPSVLAVLRRR